MSARPIDFSYEPDEERKVGNARPISFDEKDISRFRSIISAPIKGLIKGGIDVAKFIPKLVNFHPGQIIPYAISKKSLLPKQIEEPIQQGLEKAEQFSEEMLPTRPEFLESGLERGGKLAGPVLVGAATGGGGLLPGLISSAIGGFAGQGIEEAGGGPLLQALGEISPFAAPSLARKIIPASAEQAKFLAFGRGKGLSEEQLAPLMPESAKKRFFGKLASSNENTQDILKGTREGLQNIFQSVERSPQAKQFLSQKELNKFAIDMNALGKKMPFNIRSQLKNDAKDLVNAAKQKGGVSGEELMNFYHDISSRYNLGRSQLELFKNPIRSALKSINPEMASDFDTVNKMYQKSIQIGRILKPSQYEQLISLGEAYETGAAIGGLDPGRLIKILGMVGFRKFSEKMLTSPRLQNLIKKTQVAIEKNKLPLIKELGEQILREYREE